MTAALWIRVEAHDIDSREIIRFAAALGVSDVTALGYCTVLAGAIAEHTDDGNIVDVTNEELEKWGRWTGKRGRFAIAVRETLQSGDGTYRSWIETMGQLVERRAKDRRRKEIEREKREAELATRPRKVRGTSAESPRTVQGTSTVTERNGTGRNGTGDNASTSSVIKSGISPSEKGPAFSDLSEGELRARLPEKAGEFVDWFYPDHGRRRRDVLKQLATLATGGSVTYRKQQVFAYNAERLDLKCLELIESKSVDNPDNAMAYLLTMLGDTSDGSAPGQREAEERREALDEEPIHPDVEELITGITAARSMPKPPTSR